MIDNKFFPFTVLDFKRHIVCSIHHHSITMCPRQISGIWLISFDDIRSLSRNLCGNAKQRSFLIVVYFFHTFKEGQYDNCNCSNNQNGNNQIHCVIHSIHLADSAYPPCFALAKSRSGRTPLSILYNAPNAIWLSYPFSFSPLWGSLKPAVFAAGFFVWIHPFVYGILAAGNRYRIRGGSAAIGNRHIIFEAIRGSALRPGRQAFTV